ncbi:MAG: PaaI family thioesterase [Syntrophomonas sp.]
MKAENCGIEESLFNYLIESISHTPFYQLLGVEIAKVGKGMAELAVCANQNHTNPLGAIHGGLIMSLADAAMGNAIRSLGIKGVTVDCSTAFISGALLGELVVGKGRVLKAGRNMIFAEAEVFAGEHLIASSKATFFKTGEIDF